MSAKNDGAESERPTEADAAAILEAVFGETAASVARFTTGLHHFVYDTTTTTGCRAVVRVTLPAERETFAEAVRLSRELRPRGVPLPQLLHVETDMRRFAFPFMILDRLPGTDLGDVHDGLSRSEKAAIAHGVMRAQAITATLPRGHGFGFAGNADARLHATWREVVTAHLARSRSRRLAAGASIFRRLYRHARAGAVSARHHHQERHRASLVWPRGGKPAFGLSKACDVG